MQKKCHGYPSVNDLLEMDGDSTAIDVGVLVTLVDQNADLLAADLVGTVTKHKQHGVYHVGLAAAIWPHD